jgi:hypothetical protein
LRGVGLRAVFDLAGAAFREVLAVAFTAFFAVFPPALEARRADFRGFAAPARWAFAFTAFGVTALRLTDVLLPALRAPDAERLNPFVAGLLICTKGMLGMLQKLRERVT